MTLKNVVFDVGRVLIEWDMRLIYYKMGLDDAAIDEFIDEVDFFGWNLEMDGGKLFADGVKDLSAKFPHRSELIRAFDERWAESTPNAIDGSVKLLVELKAQGVPVYAITNFNQEKWVEACEKYPFLATSFLDVVVSGDEKMLKPDVAIFNLLCKRNNLSTAECLFIDDSEKNVIGAKAAGWDAVLFTDPTQLETDLTARKILKRGLLKEEVLS